MGRNEQENTQKDARKKRLTEALRRNLARRKQSAREAAGSQKPSPKESA